MSGASSPGLTGGGAANGGAVRLERAIRAATAAGRPAFAAFLTAGFPRRAGFDALVRDAAAAADVVEIGVPFSDPMADGVTLQRTSRAALAGGVDLGWILEVASTCANGAPMVLMSYLNPLLAYGARRLVHEAGAAGLSGFVVPDLPHEESLPFRDLCDAAGLALVPMVTPVTPEPRLRTIAAAGRGFLYAVTSTGTTGGAAVPESGVLQYLDRVRAVSPAPVLAGFGIRTAAQVRALAGHVDGVIVGSALAEAIERGESPGTFLRGLGAGATPRKEEGS
jgi:tryptophan synthase alpha chain